MMQIQAIRLAEFRRFHDGFELRDLQPGINLITGPNEAGKSTIATAIRAAFLERYRTGTVTDFAPYGSSGARPTVELDFTVAGREYRLRKTFLNRARCDLGVVGGTDLDGDQAEEALAQLLGFALPGRGQSRPEHAGIPGLLWLRQGDSGEREAVQHAGTHVRDALARISGEIASEDGDRVLTRVQAERNVLLDARGKPRGAYRETLDALAGVQAECERLQAAQATLEAAVDRLGTLRQAQADDERDKPWLVFEAQAAEARAREQAARQDKAALDALQQESAQFDAQIGLLVAQWQRDQQDDEELAALGRSGEGATQAVAAAVQALAGATATRETAQQALQAVRAQVEAARALAERRDVESLLTSQRAELARLQGALEAADALQGRLDQAVRVQQACHMAPEDLAALRAVHGELDALAMRRDAVATRLRFSLGQATVLLDGQALPVEGERLIAEPAELQLADGGTLQIVPGGKDLAELAQAEATARTRRDTLLRTLDEPDLAAAEARFERLQAAGHDVKHLQRELKIHAPKGIEALRASVADSDRQTVQLQARLASLPAPTGPVQDAAALQGELRWAQQAVEQADAALDESRERRQRATAQAEQLTQRRDALAARIADAATQQDRAERAARLTHARTHRDALAGRIEAARVRLAAHQPALIQQDIERFERSARIARDAFQARQHDMLLLQGRLDEAGAQGLGETRLQAEAQRERLTQRRDGLAARADALELLLSMLRAQHTAATQRLLAPLTARLAHYASLLFPGGQMGVDDGFLPQTLQRGEARSAIETLSFGTQEQLAILARLAYADVLRDAGRPTLILLDDALVHSDATRLGWMKRALFDAASRHQILIFTCHGPAWRDLGVAPRVLEGIAATGGETR